MIKVLVISDLHIGEAARSRDFRPPNYDISSCLEDNYKIDFVDFVNKEKIVADYLVVSGDITDKASCDEFMLAKEIINDIATSAGVSETNIICIPGNHDVDWSVLKGVSDTEKEYKKGKRYDTFIDLFAKNNAQLLSLVQSPYYSIWEYADIAFVGLNSAYHDNPDCGAFNYGLVDSNAVKAIDEILKSKLKDKIKVFMIHHHPYQYNAIDGADGSIIQNAEELLSMLSQNDVDMLIHGHKHIPNIITQSTNGLRPLPILCAGSFSVLLNQKLNGVALNTFHLITFEDKNSKADLIRGFVENYSYVYPRKWGKCSKENSRLIPKQGFGEYGSITDWLNKIIPIINEKISGGHSIFWSELCAKMPSLDYCHPVFVAKLVSEIEMNLNIKCLETSDEKIFINIINQ